MKETLALRLNRIIEERALKQVDILRLAEPYYEQTGAKLTRADLSQYVHGKTEPGQRKLTLLSLALGVDETWLMGYDVPQTEEIVKETPNIRRIARAGARMSPDQQEKLLKLAEALFPECFTEGDADD